MPMEKRTNETFQEHRQHPALHEHVKGASHFMCVCPRSVGTSVQYNPQRVAKRA